MPRLVPFSSLVLAAVLDLDAGAPDVASENPPLLLAWFVNPVGWLVDPAAPRVWSPLAVDVAAALPGWVLVGSGIVAPLLLLMLGGAWGTQRPSLFKIRPPEQLPPLDGAPVQTQPSSDPPHAPVRVCPGAQVMFAHV